MKVEIMGTNIATHVVPPAMNGTFGNPNRVPINGQGRSRPLGRPHRGIEGVATFKGVRDVEEEVMVKRRKEKGKAMVQVLSIDELEISINEDEHVSVDGRGWCGTIGSTVGEMMSGSKYRVDLGPWQNDKGIFIIVLNDVFEDHVQSCKHVCL
ncbi:hypothetical protein JHK87_004660 [Glycine soja]|nr:hypothetical protein JHK87_004660 [Glycine soja]